jgi:hypothetical protein
MARYLTLFTFCVATAFLNAPNECLLAVTRMRSEDWLSALRAVVGSAHPPCTCGFAGPVDAALSDVGRGAQNLRRIPPFEHSGHGQVSAGERGVATLGCVIYQPGTEHVEQISDLEVTASLGIMRELCGAVGARTDALRACEAGKPRPVPPLLSDRMSIRFRADRAFVSGSSAEAPATEGRSEADS